MLPFLPSVLVLNETKLDSACCVPTLVHYTVLERRDRNRNGGGVLVFVLVSLCNLFSPLVSSSVAEIMWFLFYYQLGPVLIACWYRPPHYGEIASINAVSAEWSVHSALAVGTVVVGDLNLHHTGWLRFSRGVTPEGTAMQHWCTMHGFHEKV